MAQKDARIRFLERELAEREKEMETMKDQEQPPVQEAEDERLRDLERKMRELEAVVKGLTEEVLDVKSVMMKTLRDVDERRKAAAETKKAGISLKAEPRIMAEPRPAHAADQKTPARQTPQRAPAPVPAPVDDRDLELIMQNDGTLRPEARRSSEYIVASTGSGIATAKGRGKSGKQSERKLFVEQKKRPIDDVIQAEEDDTVDLDR